MHAYISNNRLTVPRFDSMLFDSMDLITRLTFEPHVGIRRSTASVVRASSTDSAGNRFES